MPTTHPRRILALTGLLAMLLGATADPAGARTRKPAGPSLSIESKTCNTGQAPDARSIVLTASAVLRSVGDEVQMRFTVQQRPKTKTSWRTVFAKTGDLGTWATSEAGVDGLRYTKTINGLAEGTQYRLLVDARAITTAGKVVTRTTRRSYTCIQPQYSARVVIDRLTWKTLPESSEPELFFTLRNSGREASGPISLILTDPTTGTFLSKIDVDGLDAGERTRGFFSAPCAVTIATWARDDYGKGDATAMDTATTTCPSATKARRNHRS